MCDELPPIHVERVQMHLVQDHVFLHGLISVRVEVVALHHPHTPLCRRDHKWANPRHDVIDGVLWVEEAGEADVLRLQAGVPVHFGIVEPEDAAVLPHFSDKVINARQELHIELPELSLDGPQLVDDRSQRRNLIQQHLADDKLVRLMGCLEVQVCNVSHLLEGRWDGDAGWDDLPQHFICCHLLVAQLHFVLHHFQAPLLDQLRHRLREILLHSHVQ
mmetsp:Transcript_17884/g.31727  ORF Transcript_17884/g.31727 Transcript_17884/m.31727 type:complete len:218 (-) Transcript_17884:226-879(-)